MIELRTGLPGNFKTNLAITDIEARRVKENREVYYSGIRGLTLPWTEYGEKSPDPEKPWFTDGRKWYELPVGAIIVIDEAQRFLSPREPKDSKHITELAIHRHRGYDIYLITQDPMFLHAEVRKLVQEHRHYMRKFMSSWVTEHLWPSGHKPNVAQSRTDSITSQRKGNKEAYGWYVSTEQNTAKLKVPWKVWAIVALPIFVIGGFMWVFRDRTPKPPEKPAAAQMATAEGMPAVQQVAVSERPKTASEYLADQIPRVPGLPHTAPRYDELTKPVRVPVFVGCVIQGDTSYCVTQQGTKQYPPPEFVRSFIERGWFRDFDKGPDPDSVQAGQPLPPSPQGSPFPQS